MGARLPPPGKGRALWISDLDLLRPTLQRTNGWIADELQQLASEQPELLRIESGAHSDRVQYYARQQTS